MSGYEGPSYHQSERKKRDVLLADNQQSDSTTLVPNTEPLTSFSRSKKKRKRKNIPDPLFSKHGEHSYLTTETKQPVDVFEEAQRYRTLENKKEETTFERSLKQQEQRIQERLQNRETLNQHKKETAYEEKRTSTPFRASAVPSPMYGFLKEEQQEVDYEELESLFLKEKDTYLLFEEESDLSNMSEISKAEALAVEPLEDLPLDCEPETVLSEEAELDELELEASIQRLEAVSLEMHSQHVAITQTEALSEAIAVSEEAHVEAEALVEVPLAEATVIEETLEIEDEATDEATLTHYQEEIAPAFDASQQHTAAYLFPSLQLLKPPSNALNDEQDEWVLTQATLLNESLSAFGVEAQVVSWTVGPAVTQFELQLGRGVKVNKITNLSDDLKLALAAKDIRIEAPIPGKSTVGVEIPNLKMRAVMLSEVMSSKQFMQSTSPLTVAIGVNLSGEAVVSTLDKMPHGLIAGATGSGKSVFINSLLVSLLYKANPSELKLILIDPKAVELAPYNDIPHLLSPVISEPKAAAEALKWAVDEMETRYQKLAAAGVRNIEKFNEKAEQAEEHGLKLPYIVIIIDELADLMMVASNEVQDYIARITQKARAAGIHLIVATQRPSVDVITGTIKNNIPTRVAFMVSSQVDSRTIIDVGGAERLLGRGDMLFLENGIGQPIRVQGTYVEEEIDQIVQHVKDQRAPQYLFEPETLLARISDNESQDEYYDQVLELMVEQGNISVSVLQRKFNIGYNRAARIVDQLEEQGLISGNNGSKPRDVYLTKDELAKRQYTISDDC
ncbi:DNA translocase FtsK [Isobaculum melis]|uniref:DNA translocase FtsK n=1 Tax=Isobaculum melis TaxID=142588 RepID=A0A1H9SA68_9LACT|nr:DNA translocase FtsK [Isobaculum melis]SER81069.1 DNA segregation ATPase FtsK/SpoIIIE, S-DNA-T family [Isobaculum melis]